MNRILIFLCCFFLFGCSPGKPKLHLFIWGDFINSELIEEFEKKFQCKVVIDTYDSNEAMYAKLKSGASGYDLIFPTGYILPVMERQNMLLKLDPSLIPNIANIDFTELEILKETKHANAIPYAITFSAIVYIQDKVKNLENSWNVFARSDLKGRMTLLNDMREVLGAALKSLRFSANTIKKHEIDLAVAKVVDWKKNIAKFESEQYKNGIASSEYLVSMGYSSDIMQLAEEDEEVKLMLPIEGGIFSCDYVAIPKGAVREDLAHAFINFLLEPSSAAKNMETNFYLSPNKFAHELLCEELKGNLALFPPKSFLSASEVIEDLGENIRLYIDAWERVKSSRLTKKVF